MSVACACSDGRTGAQTCPPDGTFAACECTGGQLDGGVGPRDDGGLEPTADGAASFEIVRTAPAGDRVHAREIITLQLYVRGASPDRVDVVVDGEVLLELPAPYTFAWDTRAYTEGEHEIVGRAVRGSATATTAPLTVIVDRTAPRVVSRTPLPDEANAWLGEPIVLGLSEPLAPASVTDAAVTISAGDAIGLRKTLALSADATTLTLSLQAAPALPAIVRVDTGAVATDLAGNPVQADSFTFNVPEWARAGDTAEVPSTLEPVGVAAMAVNDAGAPCAAWLIDSPSQLHVSCFDGTAWRQLGATLNVDPTQSASSPSIVVDAAGQPSVAWRESVTNAFIHVARWTGTAWAPLGAPFTGENASSPRLELDSTDQPLLAWTTTQHTVHVHRWSGTDWARVGTELASVDPIFRAPALAVTSTGEVLVGWAADRCQVRSWDGSEWVALGAAVHPSLSCAVLELAIGPDDVPVAATSTGGSSPSTLVSRWTGSTWTSLGSYFFSASTPSLGVGDDNQPLLAYVNTSTGSSGGVNVHRYTSAGWIQLGLFPMHTSSVMDLYSGGSPALLMRRGTELEVYRHNGI